MPGKAEVPFRIAHISDLHLTRQDTDLRSEPKVLGRLSGMNDRFRNLVRSTKLNEADLLVVTGDVTDRGHLQAWQTFWTTLDQVGLANRTLVVPGNHDVCCLGVRMPGKQHGYHHSDLQKALDGITIPEHHPKEIPWVVRPDPRIAVFGLSSNNLGNWNATTNAMGAIGYYQLSEFARLLRDSHEPIKVVALHHSPNIPAEQVEVKRGLQRTTPLARRGHQIDSSQRRALRLLCISAGVRLMIHGHLHRAEDRRVDGVRIVGVPASTQPRISAPHAGKCEFATYVVSGASPRVSVRWHLVDV